MNMNSNPVKWVNRLVSEPYYLLHFLALFTYIPVRCSAANVLSPHRSAHLLHREIQALLAFSVFAAVKVIRSESWEAFIADTLFYAKFFLTAIALVLDYHLAFWYALAFFVLYIIVQQPAYEGLGTTSQLTPLQLETVLTEGNTSKFWMVGAILKHVILVLSFYFLFDERPTSMAQAVNRSKWNFVLCLCPVAYDQVLFSLNFQLHSLTNFCPSEQLILDSFQMLLRSLESPLEVSTNFQLIYCFMMVLRSRAYLRSITKPSFLILRCLRNAFAGISSLINCSLII